MHLNQIRLMRIWIPKLTSPGPVLTQSELKFNLSLRKSPSESCREGRIIFTTNSMLENSTAALLITESEAQTGERFPSSLTCDVRVVVGPSHFAHKRCEEVQCTQSNNSSSVSTDDPAVAFRPRSREPFRWCITSGKVQSFFRLPILPVSPSWGRQKRAVESCSC